MRGSRTLPARFAALAAASGLVLAGCVTPSAGEPEVQPTAMATSTPPLAVMTPLPSPQEIDRPVRIGWIDAPSNRLMAELYARVLKEAGYEAELTVAGLNPVFIEAMQRGEVDVLPAYSGLFADVLYSVANPGGTRPATTDVPTTLAAANELAAQYGIRMLDAAPGAEDAAFFVGREFAESTGVRTLSELAVWSRTNAIRLGGDPSCDVRPYCRPNLEATYGMRFKEFVPLSIDGTVVKAAIDEGSIELGFVPTSDPVVDSPGVVVLEKDIPLTIVANLAPVVRSAIATPTLVDALNSATATIDDAALADLLTDVSVQYKPLGPVVAEFIADSGLGEGLYDGPIRTVDVVLPPAAAPDAGPDPSASALSDGKVHISYAPIFDSEVAARIYAAALASAGIPVQVDEPAEPEDLLAALSRGELSLAPMRLNVAANILSLQENGPLKRPIATRSVEKLTSSARALALPRGIAVLEPTLSNARVVFAVSDQFAAQAPVRTLSDLARVSRALPVELGAPPSCPTQSWCLPLLRDGYGVTVGAFVPLDDGGPLTRAAVDLGDVDVAVLRANDGAVELLGLKVLEDDLGREPVNPITPLMNRAAVTPDISRVVRRVSAALTSEDLARMNRQVEYDREDMVSVVQEFLESKGLTDSGPADSR